MFEKIKEIFAKTGDTVREYPMVLLMALLAALSMMCFAELNYGSNANYFVFVRFAIVTCLGISLMFALKMLSQRIGRGFLLEISGVLFLIIFYFLLPGKEQYFTEKYAYLIVPTFILSHLLVSFTAFTGRRKELNFWQFNKNLFVNIFLTAVFTGVLTGGVELAILAVDKLFDFNFDGRLYVETFYLLAIFGSSFIFLLFNEKGLAHLEKEGKYPLVLKFFTQYILIPLLIIYAVILYFYAAKILINWELPRGWVSYLTLAYSVVGILALLLVHPLKDDSTKSWVKLFSKIFYYSVSPLLILLFTAIFTRIVEYGYTEPRYFVLLMAVWLTSVVLYFAFSRKTTIKFVPISLFAFILFALVFPYLNTFSVAKRSQKSELEKVLNENNLVEDGKINFNKKVSDTVAEAVTSKFVFLTERGEASFLLNMLGDKEKKIFGKNLHEVNEWAVRDNLRNLFTNVVSTKRNQGFNRLEIFTENNPQNISGYNYMVRFSDLYTDRNIIIGNDVFTVNRNTGMTKLQIEIILNKNEKWDLTEFLRETMQNHKGKKGRIAVPEISTEKDLGNYHVKVLFDNLVLEEVKHEQIYFSDGFILIKKK